MAFDGSKIGQHVAAMMEALERDFGDGAEIGDVCIVVEVLTRPGENNPFDSQHRMRFTGRPHHAIGLLRSAERSLLELQPD
jgi:hypothetical protein